MAFVASIVSRRESDAKVRTRQKIFAERFLNGFAIRNLADRWIGEWSWKDDLRGIRENGESGNCARINRNVISI